jgi:hypothetical protein
MEEYKPLAWLYENQHFATSHARRILEAPHLEAPSVHRLKHCFFESWLELWPQEDATDEKKVTIPENYIKYLEQSCLTWLRLARRREKELCELKRKREHAPECITLTACHCEEIDPNFWVYSENHDYWCPQNPDFAELACDCGQADE